MGARRSSVNRHVAPTVQRCSGPAMPLRVAQLYAPRDTCRRSHRRWLAARVRDCLGTPGVQWCLTIRSSGQPPEYRRLPLTSNVGQFREFPCTGLRVKPPTQCHQRSPLSSQFVPGRSGSGLSPLPSLRSPSLQLPRSMVRHRWCVLLQFWLGLRLGCRGRFSVSLPGSIRSTAPWHPMHGFSVACPFGCRASRVGMRRSS